MHHAHIDKFAYQDSPVHHLDPRVKLAVTLVFTVLVVSLPRTALGPAFCYVTGPFVLLVLAGIPLGFALRHVLLVSPFVLVLALSCPFYDRTQAAIPFGPWTWHVSYGWMRCFTICVKFAASMLALITLVSTTRFSDLLTVLQRWYVPEILVIQLGFLYRYLFVLIDKAHHILRARRTRTLTRLGLRQEFRVAIAMIGSLLVQSLDAAERITRAMEARGFVGRWHSLRRFSLGHGDWLFLGVALVYTVAIRLFF